MGGCYNGLDGARQDKRYYITFCCGLRIFWPFTKAAIITNKKILTLQDTLIFTVDSKKNLLRSIGWLVFF